jgi:hypothetical protein
MMNIFLLLLPSAQLLLLKQLPRYIIVAATVLKVDDDIDYVLSPADL